MKTIQVPIKEQVSADSQAIFNQLHKRLGKVPNLYATIGYSANALKGFLDFEATVNKGAFSPKEREAIALIVSEINGCNYCLAAHSMLAIKNGFTKEETLSIRRADVSDAKLQSILQLAKSIVVNKGHAGDTELENFFAAGFDEAAVMELIGLITVRVFTNYVYALTDIPVDFPAAEPIK
ncbi:carboxymuconolactone decarboxylase family protein [Chitinophaga agrisoli]|uniref:Carboxymuconolactone decarboxylase family protein n=1 Tax=Chitinophaga agrisoli TaxID=2607653 RepID=A0A5B2VLV0_9BACT|nr:carboxymuconolactone decarboxylase family protein [Chitinophaga agrisoli]KAA2240051.1 carboxymuconolactone decarboxylase family protein [Chitinophaga agrisoli]